MKRSVYIAIVVMGFSGLVAEILLLRELLIVFSGNELCIGIILANWLILEAFGCFFPGRMAEKSKNRLEIFILITILFSLALLTAIFLTRILKNILGISIGESIGFLPMFYTSFLILLPVSILHGALFTFSCQIYAGFSNQDASTAGRVYIYETVGTLIGGIISTYLLIPYLDTFQAAFGIAILNLVVGLVLLAPNWKTGLLQKSMLVITGVLVLLSGYLLLGGHVNRLHQYAIQMQWKNLNVVHYQNSPYGNICTIENQGQYIFFQDGIPTIITPVPDIVFVEEFVHLPLLAHPYPENILILSGGAGGVINEVLKHPSIETIEYAELDPLLLKLIREFPTPLTEAELNAESVKVRHIDGRLLLKTTPHHYDLIFVGIMEPSSLQANRFFTKEFFSLATQRLNAGGILVLGAPGSFMFLNEELKNLNSSIYHTLRSVFLHIRVIPGDGVNIFLASDSPDILLVDEAQVVKRVHERNIVANMTVPRHIENKLHDGWRDWFMHFIDGSSHRINRDFQPLGLFYSIAHWNAVFAPSFGRLFNQFERINLGIISLVFGLFLFLYFILRSRNINIIPESIPFAIITTGFAGMIFDLVVIFAFQSLYGYVFSWIGLLVAFFMAGAACGAMLITMAMERMKSDVNLFIKIEVAIICLSVGLPILFLAVSAFMDRPGAFAFFRILFLFIPFIGGLLIGSQFPLANKLYLKKSVSLGRTAGLLYAADLLGGWLGGVVGAVMILPVLGLAGTCIAVGLLKLASLIIIVTQLGSLSVRR